MKDEPNANIFFNSLSDTEQQAYINWIYTAKKEKTKIERLATAINLLTKRIKN